MKSKSHDSISIIGQGVSISGNIEDAGDIRIDGHIKGDITSSGNLILGEHGEIQGNIKARSADVSGKIYGQITAEEKIVLEKTGSVTGDIICRTLVVEEGASFTGRSSKYESAPQT
ncbi:MAG: polymer-forming cytoskeletal protein [Ignavibacteriaceae bacterium]|nr:polymer-forming cytoskeletal protein [Ignavibacteriaceae bacterium]NUM70012.1 polymer-forming cytoskeletal protein [Ignavibacteriaceae bacterium]